jgi:hypothetical protein
MAAKATPAEGAEPKPTKAAKTAAAKAARTTAAKPAQATPTKAPPPNPAPAEPVTGEADTEQVPMNRAERRAKGRGKAVAQVPGARGKVSGSHGPAHTQRNWANRRTG